MRILFFVLALLCNHKIVAQKFTLLDSIGITHSRSISAGQEHRFALQLKKGEVVLLTVVQNGVDIVATTTNPDQVTEEFDTDNGANGLEVISIVGRSEGLHKISIKPLETKTKNGNYTLTFKNKKFAGPSGRDILVALLDNWNSLDILPGFGVAVMSKDKIIFEGGFGFSDIASKKPYNIHTIQNIGSVSKTLIGISLMQLVAENKIKLNSYINDHLPFRVVNPRHFSTPIKVEHLATHTSSISEMPAYEKSYILTKPSLGKKEKFERVNFDP